MASTIPTKDGLIEEGDNKTVEEFKYPETEEEADQIIKQFEAASTRSDDLVSGSVAQHALLDSTGLVAEKWLGTEEEERDWYGFFQRIRCLVLLSVHIIAMSPSCATFIPKL
jgi:hypothetical protein